MARKLEQRVAVTAWVPDWLSTVSISRSKDISVSRYWRTADGAAAGDNRYNTREEINWQNDIRLGHDT